MQLEEEDGYSVPIHHHFTIKFHPYQGQHQHVSNLTAKGGMDLGDKGLDEGVTDMIISFGGILAGSMGAG